MARRTAADTRKQPQPSTRPSGLTHGASRTRWRFAALPLRIRADLVRQGRDLRRRWYRFRSLGARGERYAARYLRRQGMKIVGRQVRMDEGELDLVAVEGRTVVFVEVKTRRSLAFGPPKLAVHFRKQRQIVRAAEWFLAARRLTDVPCRFDVLGVTFPETDEEPRIEWVRDAFPAEGLWVG